MYYFCKNGLQPANVGVIHVLATDNMRLSNGITGITSKKQFAELNYRPRLCLLFSPANV